MSAALARLAARFRASCRAGLQSMGSTSDVGNLFSSHPPIEERIAALQQAPG
jgi:heat shock protein HtpX